MHVSIVFVHNEIRCMCFAIGTCTISLCTTTTIGVYILVLLYTHCSYTWLCRAASTHTHVHDKVNPLLKLLVPEDVVQHSLHNPSPPNYVTQWSNAYFLVQRGRKNILGSVSWRRCMVEESLAFLHIVCRKERVIWLHKRGTCIALLICKQWLAVQYAKLIQSILQLERREMRSKVQCCSISLLTYHVTYYCIGFC